MPELPDIDVYVDVLARKLENQVLDGMRFGSPFLLHSVEPPPEAAVGRKFTAARRIGKRIALGFEGELWFVIHLMVAGRLHWKASRPSLAAKNALAAFDFPRGSLLLTEAGSRKRASLYVVAGERGLAAHDPGGIEPLRCCYEDFRDVVQRENHTLKRALTDPRLISGIGNAYSDEILHRARLSPVALTSRLDAAQVRALYEATVATLSEWRDTLLTAAGAELPENVTAFRDGMRVHGRYGKPCPNCGEPVQRIRYKDNETNYCAGCQTGSRVLRDRSLSRLLRDDWPSTLDELQGR